MPPVSSADQRSDLDRQVARKRLEDIITQLSVAGLVLNLTRWGRPR
ncbi:hypothetical protein [Mycolicibacterium vanbaalenii]|nr:hypothetical protein [Mycolicibacterium vanbaalenii]